MLCDTGMKLCASGAGMQWKLPRVKHCPEDVRCARLVHDFVIVVQCPLWAATEGEWHNALGAASRLCVQIWQWLAACHEA